MNSRNSCDVARLYQNRFRDPLPSEPTQNEPYAAQNGLRPPHQVGCVPRFVEKERRPPLRHQGIRSGGNLRVFENLAQTLVAVDAS